MTLWWHRWHWELIFKCLNDIKCLMHNRNEYVDLRIIILNSFLLGCFLIIWMLNICMLQFFWSRVKSDHVAWILASDWLVCLLSWCNIAVWLTDWHQWRSHVLGMIPPWQWREPRYTEADPSSGHPRQELTPDTWPRNVKHDCIIINRLKAWTNNLSWESGSSIPYANTHLKWIWRHSCLENRIGLLWKDAKSFYTICASWLKNHVVHTWNILVATS